MSDAIQLPQNMTIHHIDEHFNGLNEKINEIDSQVTLDAGPVETIDTSGLQTLLMLVKSITENNKELTWENVPEVLTTSAQKVGLEEDLQF